VPNKLKDKIELYVVGLFLVLGPLVSPGMKGAFDEEGFAIWVCLYTIVAGAFVTFVAARSIVGLVSKVRGRTQSSKDRS
jgi:uncharacterized membrane protein (DUF4010 family)